MAMNRNEIREAALKIHDDLLAWETERLQSPEKTESGQERKTAEYNISRQFILLLCSAYMHTAGPAMPSDPYPQGYLFERFPGIFGDFRDVVMPSDALLGEVTDVLEEIMEAGAENEGPQIMGRIYQYFTGNEHDRAVDALKRKKISAEEIPAATQLFTADWIVRYLVDNSLGRLWLNGHPGSALGESLKYLVRSDGAAVKEVRESPSDMPGVFDPCVGSGNFLIYAFDVLMRICMEKGLSPARAAQRILSEALFGADIDHRVVTLARFSLMMKAMNFGPDVRERDVCRNIITIREPDRDSILLACSIGGTQSRAAEVLRKLTEIYENASENGSITVLEEAETSLLPRCREILSDKAYAALPGAERLLDLVRQTEVLSCRYDVVVTNPPYLSRYEGQLKEYVAEHYPKYGKDLFGVFIYRCSRMLRDNGYLGMMTPMVWMFIRSFKNLRVYITSQMSVVTLTQMEYSAFEDATVPICAFVLGRDPDTDSGVYFRLTDFTGGMQVQREKLLEAVSRESCPYRYVTDGRVFSLLPDTPIAYWVSSGMLSVFEKGIPLGEIASSKQGLATTDNDRYLRLWYEVRFSDIGFGMNSTSEAASSGYRWFPYNKGGDFRKWYGNNDWVVNYENDGEEIKGSVMEKYPYLVRPDYVVKNTQFYFRPSASWSLISSSDTAFRYKPAGFIFDVAGMSLFCEEHLMYLLALCNSAVAREILRIIAPTINFQCGDIARIPVIMADEKTEKRIEELTEENIELCREDWDSFETSWDFRKHPLV